MCKLVQNRLGRTPGIVLFAKKHLLVQKKSGRVVELPGCPFFVPARGIRSPLSTTLRRPCTAMCPGHEPHGRHVEGDEHQDKRGRQVDGESIEMVNLEGG